MPIIKTFTADGTSDAFTVNNQVVSAYGTFGGGTLTLRKKIGGTFYALANDDSTTGLAVTSNASAAVTGHHTCDFSLYGATNPNIVTAVE